MLNITGISYAPKANYVKFGSKQGPDIATLEGKKAILQKAKELEEIRMVSESEEKYNLVFERPDKEFQGDEGIKTLNDAGIGLARVLGQQGFDSTLKIKNGEKAVEVPVTLAKLNRRLLSIGDSSQAFDLADYAHKKETQMADRLPSRLQRVYLDRLLEENVF